MERNYYGKKALLDIDPINRPAFTRFVEQLKLKGYNPSTVKTYSVEFAQLLKSLKQYPVENLSAEKQFDRLLIAAVSYAPDFKSRIYNRNKCG